MKFFYLSDIHLRYPDEDRSKKFINFLQKIPALNDTIVLGGDIFDLYVGDKKHFRKKFAPLLEAIRDAEKRGCTIYYLEGNHDFHLGKIFRRQEHIFIMKNDFEIKWGRKTFWISHGDQIDKEDYGYRILRFTTRTLAFRAFLKAVPDFFVKTLGEWSSKTSRKYNDTEKMSAERKERTKQLFRNYASEKISQGYDFVFIGHSHQEDRVQFRFGGRGGEYLNLGYSAHAIIYAEYSNESCELQLKTFI